MIFLHFSDFDRLTPEAKTAIQMQEPNMSDLATCSGPTVQAFAI